MANKIITKFTIGTEEGIKTLLFIGVATAREKYAGKVADDQLEAYIGNNFTEDVLHVEMNSLSNQYLVVYVDDKPAGYARITTKGQRPGLFNGKTVTRIADFAVLKQFDSLEVKDNLFEKCLSVSSMQQIVWISEYDGNPDLEFFESYGFKINTEIQSSHELGLPAIYLVKDKATGGS